MGRTTDDSKKKRERSQKMTREQANENEDLFSSQSLKNAPRFNPMMTLGQACAQVAYNILETVWQGKGKREPHWTNKKKEALIVFANLLSNKRKVPVAISLDPNKKDADGQEREVNRPRIELIKLLEEHGYIDRHPGHILGEKRESARIAPTRKCLEKFRQTEKTDAEHEQFEPVILKERRRSKQQHPQKLRFEENETVFDKTFTVKDLCEFIESMSTMYAKHRIELPPLSRDEKINTKLNTNFHFVFSGSFDGGGRLNVCGGSNNYQKLNKRNREKILIDGEKTIELDFSGTHVMMLYAKKGKQYEGNDVYGDICPEKSDLRPIFKTALLCMLNAKSDKEAVRACNEAIYVDKDGRDKLQPIMKKYGLRVDDIMQLVKKHHKRIEDYFCIAPCHELMNLEARIAVDVLSFFLKRDIPVLFVHESFIIQENHKDRLESVMKKMYRHHTGFEIRVK